MRKLDLTGQTFGRLTVIAPAAKRKEATQWQCQCACGERVNVDTKSLRIGNTKSCGCLRKELFREVQKISHRGRRFETFNGETMTVNAWAARIGVPYRIFYQRLARKGIAHAMALGGAR